MSNKVPSPIFNHPEYRIRFKRYSSLTSLLLMACLCQFTLPDLGLFKFPFQKWRTQESTNIDQWFRSDVEITYTNYGWYHPDPEEGLKHTRCMAMKSFHDAVIVHERYNASVWNHLNQNPNPNRTIFAFLDLDACHLRHWPIFAGFKWNSDEDGGRSPFFGPNYKKICPAVDLALQSPALAAPDSRLIVLSCMEFGPEVPCLSSNRTGLYSKLVVGHMSAFKNQTHPLDFGLPPWPVKTVSLNQSQIDVIETCQNSARSLLFAFMGRERISFQEFADYLRPLHGKHGVHAVFTTDHYINSPHPVNFLGKGAIGPTSQENQTNDEYYTLLTNSVFSGAPLGDCAYSVRFSEILSSGSIPVVYSDNWVLPYNRDVVDWSELAVLLPQRLVNETLATLQAIPNEKRCEMSRNGYNFFKNYVADSQGRLKGVLQVMDAALKRRRKVDASDPVELSFMPAR